MIHFFVLALLTVRTTGYSYPTAALSCPAGQAAVSGQHTDVDNVVTGSLEDGGFSFSFAGRAMSNGDVWYVEKGANPISVSGATQFKGILIRAEPRDEILVYPDFDLFSQDGMTSMAQFQLCYPGSGLVHSDPEPKTSVSGVFTVLGNNVIDIDVTVVVSSTNAKSEYYYSRYTVNAKNCKQPGESCKNANQCCFDKTCVGDTSGKNQKCKNCKDKGQRCNNNDECCEGFTCKLVNALRGISKCRP